ncbi:MAG TPA: response regulator transcription factor [Longimicrobiales bacterium]|nr:response regulator transcription factor [Longimicrobiales bacterium]
MKSTATIRVMLVDDHELLRAGVRAMIEEHEDMLVVADASSGEDAIAQARRYHPDVVVMDLRLPGINGIEATRRIVQQDANARVLVLTMDAPEDVLLDVFEAGASGYLRKAGAAPRIVDAVRAVAEGKVVADPALVAALRARKAAIKAS